MAGASVSLRPLCLEAKRNLLSDFNVLVTESIELIEVSTDDVEKLQLGNRRKHHPRIGDVGIRCVYCAAKGIQPTGSNIYPQSLKTLPHNMYNMVVRHLMESCKNIPCSTQKRLINDKKKTTSQSMEKERIGLPVYLKLLTSEYGLADRGSNEGIHCSVAGSES